jgi:hypothetical protein
MRQVLAAARSGHPPSRLALAVYTLCSAGDRHDALAQMPLHYYRVLSGKITVTGPDGKTHTYKKGQVARTRADLGAALGPAPVGQEKYRLIAIVNDEGTVSRPDLCT